MPTTTAPEPTSGPSGPTPTEPPVTTPEPTSGPSGPTPTSPPTVAPTPAPTAAPTTPPPTTHTPMYMCNPDFDAPFDPCYEQYSQWADEAFVPSHFNYYLPDIGGDFACLSIIQPAPEKGATIWTMHGKRILIGVYRDEGRPPAKQPPIPITYVRSANLLTATTAVKHKLTRGMLVELTGLTPPLITGTVTIVDPYTFNITVPALGNMMGTGHVARVAPINFYEERVVYRYLPSMRLVPVQEIIDLFYASIPTANLKPYYDPTGGLHTGIELKVVGDNGYTGLKDVRHRQQFEQINVDLPAFIFITTAPITVPPLTTPQPVVNIPTPTILTIEGFGGAPIPTIIEINGSLPFMGEFVGGSHDIPLLLSYFGTIFYQDIVTDVPLILSYTGTIFYQDIITDVPLTLGVDGSIFYQDIITDVPLVLNTYDVPIATPAPTTAPTTPPPTTPAPTPAPTTPPPTTPGPTPVPTTPAPTTPAPLPTLTITTNAPYTQQTSTTRTFTVVTANIPNGTQLTWSVAGADANNVNLSYNTNVFTATTGIVTINNNTASFTVTITNTTEAMQGYCVSIASVFLGSLGWINNSQMPTYGQHSVMFAPTFTVTANKTNVYVGELVEYTIQSTGVQTNFKVPFLAKVVTPISGTWFGNYIEPHYYTNVTSWDHYANEIGSNPNITRFVAQTLRNGPPFTGTSNLSVPIQLEFGGYGAAPPMVIDTSVTVHDIDINIPSPGAYTMTISTSSTTTSKGDHKAFTITTTGIPPNSVIFGTVITTDMDKTDFLGFEFPWVASALGSPYTVYINLSNSNLIVPGTSYRLVMVYHGAAGVISALSPIITVA